MGNKKSRVMTHGNQKGTKTGTANAEKKAGSTKQILVQMSHEWIKQNIQRAVDKKIADEIELKGESVYSRHLFFCPAYIPEAAAHLKARYNNLPDNEHAAHKAIHYDEDDVRKAVNKRKAKLRKKYSNLPSLKDET
jgi:hypothetical protein